MSNDKLIKLLRPYEKIELEIWVQNARYIHMNFGEPCIHAEEDHNTIFITKVSKLEYKKFREQQEIIGATLRDAITEEVIKIDLKEQAELKIFNWKLYIENLLRKINMPFGESTISAEFKLQDGIKNADFTGNERRAIELFLDCQKLISSVILEPAVKYLNILERQIARSVQFSEFKNLMRVPDNDDTKFALANLSEDTSKELFKLLKHDYEFIHDDTTEEMFAGVFTNKPFLDKIKWIGSKGTFKTFVLILSRKQLIVSQPWKLIRKGFILNNFPDYFDQKNIAASSFKLDEELQKKLNDLLSVNILS